MSRAHERATVRRNGTTVFGVMAPRRWRLRFGQPFLCPVWGLFVAPERLGHHSDVTLEAIEGRHRHQTVCKIAIGGRQCLGHHIYPGVIH